MEWLALPGGWCEASRAAALSALAAVARDCLAAAGDVGSAAGLPPPPDHAGVLWRRALAAARDEDARGFAGVVGSGSGGGERLFRTGRAVVLLAEALARGGRDDEGRGPEQSAAAKAAAAETLAAWRVASGRAGGDRCRQGPVVTRVLALLEEAAADETTDR